MVMVILGGLASIRCCDFLVMFASLVPFLILGFFILVSVFFLRLSHVHSASLGLGGISSHCNCTVCNNSDTIK